MTYDSWKTTEPDDSMPRPAGCKCHWEAGDSPCPVHPSLDDDYVPDEEPPCEMSDDYPHHVMLAYANCAMATADRLGLHATITLRITSPDGSVVDVTKQSEMPREAKVITFAAKGKVQE